LAVESALAAHEDVFECAVVGRKHEKVRLLSSPSLPPSLPLSLSSGLD